MLKHLKRASAIAISAALMTAPVLAQEKLITERTLTKQSTWYQKTNVTPAQLADFVDDKNARIIDLDVQSTSPLRFSAAMVKNTGPHAKGWWWYYGLTAAQVSEKIEDKKARLLDLDVYKVNGQLRFAVVLVPNKGDQATGWWWYYGQTTAQIKQKLKDNKARLVDIERYRDGNKTRYAAVMVKNTGAKATKWWWYYGLSAAELKTKLSQKKARILDLERYKTSNGTRFAAILVPHGGSTSTNWWYYHGTSANKLVELGRRHGARLVDIEPPSNGAKGYTGVFVDNGVVTSGDCGGKLKSYDRQVKKMMKAKNIPGATIAVVKGNKLVHSCAYGYADIATNKHMKTDNLLRIASITKPITVSALRKLAADNKLNLGWKMVNNLGAAKPDGPYQDDQVKDITIQNLIDHRGGWDRGVGLNPMFMPTTIADALGVTKPASCRDIIRYMFQTQDLDYTPGTNPTYADSDTYSNFGYCILGRVIEKGSGTNYQNYVRKNILEPIGIKKMRIGRGLKANRFSKEAQYYDTIFQAKVTPVYPNGPDKVFRPDGQFHLEAMDSHGAWVASANDIARFATFVKNEPYGTGDWSHSGALLGTGTLVQVRGDVTVALLMNARLSSKDLAKVIDQGTANVSSWPTKNLWAKYGYRNPGVRATAVPNRELAPVRRPD